MKNFTYLNRKTKMTHDELLKLSYPVFLSYLKHNYIFDLQQTEEGRKQLEQIERYKVTTPDFAKLRMNAGYKAGGQVE
jgi:hypothetical protein